MTKALSPAQREARRVAKMRKDADDITGAAIDRTGANDPNVLKASSSGRKVTVVFRCGIAYLTLQLCQVVEKWENTQAGPRKIKEAIRLPQKVYIRGTGYPRGQPPDGFPEKPLIIGNAALNPNVDADFWEAWVEQNKLNPLVVNGLIYANERHDVALGRAKEEIKELSGLEPVNPRGDDRIQKSTNPSVSNIETEEARAAKMARAATA